MTPLTSLLQSTEASLFAGNASAAGAATAATGATGAAAATPFSGLLASAMERIGQLEQDASVKADGLLRGTGVDVHAAMISTERADLAFELALAVRNKAVAAYQQLNSMQF